MSTIDNRGTINNAAGRDFHVESQTFNYFPKQLETSPSPSYVIPFPRDDDFVETDYFDQIYTKCLKPGSRTALFGLGGVGKSQLAIELAYRIKEHKPDTWVFWVHAGNATRFAQGFHDIANCVRIPQQQQHGALELQAVHDWLQNVNNGTWALILDNVDDARFLSGVGNDSADGRSARPLISYIPHRQHGSVLITTRNKNALRSLVEDRDIIDIPPMGKKDAVSLLRRKLEQQGQNEFPRNDLHQQRSGEASQKDAAWQQNGKDLIELAQALEYMPLALVQAAAYITHHHPRESVQNYLKEFRRSDRRKLSFLQYDAGQSRRDYEAKNSIILTWQLSFELIRKTRTSASDLLAFMSFFDRQGISDDLLQGYQEKLKRDDDDLENPQIDDASVDCDTFNDFDRASISSANYLAFEEDIQTLRNYSLISLHGDGKAFAMHRLVQLSMQQWLHSHESLEHWKQHFIMKLEARFPHFHDKTRNICRALLPHARIALAQRPQSDFALLAWASLLSRAAYYTLDMREVREAEDMSRHATETRKKILGLTHKKTLSSMHLLVKIYGHCQRYDDAEKLMSQVVDTRTRMLGIGDKETLLSMSHLASIWRVQGRLDDAADIQEKATDILKTMLGAKDSHTIQSMSLLADIYRNQGRYDDAEKLLDHVLETSKELKGATHRRVARSMSRLARVYKAQGRTKKAENLQLQSLKIDMVRLGEEHPQTLQSSSSLAFIYTKQGKFEEAEKIQVRFIEIAKTKLKDDDRTISSMTVGLAFICYKQGRLKEAEELMVSVYETRKNVFGTNHPRTLAAMRYLAIIQKALGKDANAIDLMLKCVQFHQKVLRPVHPDLLGSLTELKRWEEEQVTKDWCAGFEGPREQQQE